MTELLDNILAQSAQHPNIILLLGIAIFGGTVGAKIFQKANIPRIVGYVAIGIIIGPLFNIISQQTVRVFEPFNFFALGIIGFLVGGELKRDIFVKFGKQVPVILLFEGVTAFLIVGILTFLAMLFFFDWQKSLAVAVVLGAICSATDPASTIAVLWEYKTRGPLTSMLTAIVTLDDALALMLYAISIGVAGVITGHQQAGIAAAFLDVFYELGCSPLLGIAVAIGLTIILKVAAEDYETTLVFTLGTLLLCIGTAMYLHLDVILACMAAGVVMTNVKSRNTAQSFEVLHKYVTAPIYTLFFVLAGARVNFSHFNTMIGILTAAYVIGMVVGKTLGSYLGALYSGAVRTIRNYLGLCLYPQGGIAIGLLIIAGSRFESDLSATMLLVVIIGAFILQIIGPIAVKIGARKSGEIGLNITEHDLINTYKVRDVMDKTVPLISAGMSLGEVVAVVSSTKHYYYPVVDSERRLIGALTLDGIRNTFATQELNDWLVALDIAEPVIAKVSPDIALSNALEKMRRSNIEQMPVIVSKEINECVGILESHSVHRQLSAEVLARQREADRMYGVRTKQTDGKTQH